MSLPTDVRAAQPRALTSSCSACSSAGKSTPAISSLPIAATGPLSPREPGSRGRLVEEALEHLEAAVDAEVVRRAERAAHEREHAAVRADEREMRLRVAAVDGEDDRSAHRDHRLLGREQQLDELLVQRVLADQRVREQSLPRDRGVAGHGRLGGEPLVGGDVLGEPEQLGRQRFLRQRHEAAGLDAARGPRRRRRRRARRACRRCGGRPRARCRRR